MSEARAVPAGHAEPHGGGMAIRLNWLRAAVLDANDGIVSTAGLVVGVAGATSSRAAILTAGLAGLFAGALAMASGEYVSVSSQRDAERAMLALERRELRTSCSCACGRRIAVSRDQGPDARLVVSEPIGDLPGVWTEVPAASYGWSVRGTTKFLPVTPRPLA